MNEQGYRVVSRAWAAAIGVLLLAAGAVIVWFAILKMRVGSMDLSIINDRSAADAAAEIVRRVHFYAWLYSGSLLAIAAWAGWIASRIIRTGRMPPAGSWIIEGQRTHTGSDALRRGRILLAVAGVLAVLAVALFVTLWRLAATIVTA